jgi:hypothetical protein
VPRTISNPVFDGAPAAPLQADDYTFSGLRVRSSLFIFARMRRVVWLCWLWAAFGTNPLPAVTMVPLEIEELTARAALIVQGTVVNHVCQRDASGRIYTKIELHVSDVWKGSLAENPLQVVHGGGRIGDQQMMVSGQVRYQAGEEIVGFFLVNDRGEAVTIGLAQGKFRVWTDARTGEKLAANLFHGNSSSSVAKAAVAEGARVQETLTVSQLKRRVQGARP